MDTEQNNIQVPLKLKDLPMSCYNTHNYVTCKVSKVSGGVVSAAITHAKKMY